MSSCKFVFANGVVSPSSETSVSAFLEAHPGAYTTSRTHDNGSLLLFWERHLHRLSDSARILLNSNTKLLFESGKPKVSSLLPLAQSSSLWDSVIRSLANDSISQVLPVALKERKIGEELAITSIVSGNSEKLSEFESLNEELFFRILDVYVHVGIYLPPVFGVPENGAHLAMVGRGRDFANAKYSDWVRLRKPLEKLRPPSATELLLSNNGNQILEGCLTNFFVVCRKENGDNSNGGTGKDLIDYRSTCSVEIQTAPVSDGVLPGVIRQVIIDICSNSGIPLREVAPSWSERDTWEEAFVTSSLRLLQHVETIRVPMSRELLESRSWKAVTWEEKRFEGLGSITALIQKEIMKKACLEGYPVNLLNS